MTRHFQSREKRDEAWKKGGRKGIRSTSHNQQLHPMYVEDWEGPEKDQTGFGNTVYRTFHSVLYNLEDR